MYNVEKCGNTLKCPAMGTSYCDTQQQGILCRAWRLPGWHFHVNLQALSNVNAERMGRWGLNGLNYLLSWHLALSDGLSSFWERVCPCDHQGGCRRAASWMQHGVCWGQIQPSVCLNVVDNCFITQAQDLCQEENDRRLLTSAFPSVKEQNTKSY